MAMNATRTQTAAAANPATLASSSPADAGRKPTGYGLPCSKCRLYYPADLDICPTCRHNERMSPAVPAVRPKAKQAIPGSVPDGVLVEKEREEFLRQFKSQLLNAHAEVSGAAESECKVGAYAAGDAASAEACKACYERLQERLDVFEAALHIDLKEAAQIIYDAVWADPSDPNKTYQNAAGAMLTELRRRAGMNAVQSPFQALPD
jgi:hypothetical protein